MNTVRSIHLLIALLLIGVAPVTAQEAPPANDPAVPAAPAEPAADPAAPAEAPTPPAREEVPPPPLPVPDPDPATTPVAPRDVSPPEPAAGGGAAPTPVDPATLPDMSPPKPAAPAKKPAASPSTIKKTTKKTTATAPRPDPTTAEAVVFTVRVGRDGPKESFLIALRPDLAPKTVENFKRNIESGFYEGLAFHRVIRNYLVQTGDPSSKDESQREQWGTTDIGQNIPGEFGGSHSRYSVAMAHKAGETTSSGSQFFIILRPATSLDGSYAVFGEVTQGMEVLNRLSGVVVDTNDVPVKRIEIVDAKIVRGDTQLADSSTTGDRRKTKPDSQKGRLERFIERVW
ncbi:MAG: peptidylprolyl isomerase [Verrucomicrobiales bacterium]